jgi:ABC-2 type transport system ATP-binding protein
MNGTPIDIQGLAKRYGSFDAVRDLSLQVHTGELFALLGPNGAGKTTTLRMLMGILQPTAGTARIGGMDCFVDRVAVKRLVGYLPDEPAFYDYLRGSELIHFVGEMHGLTRAEIARRVTPLIEKLDLKDATEEYAANYSKGMRKKLALICALLHDPQVLILDEPTNGLDPYATRSLLEIVRAQAAAGKTVFYSTHLLDQAERLCTRVGILYQGKLSAIGTLAELRARCTANSTLEEIFFTVTGDTQNGNGIPAAATQTAPAPATTPEPASNIAAQPIETPAVAAQTPVPPLVTVPAPALDGGAPSDAGQAAIQEGPPVAPEPALHPQKRIVRRAPPPQDEGFRIDVKSDEKGNTD